MAGRGRQWPSMAAKGNPLRLDEIDAISEVWEGFSLMDRHGIAKDNCACLKDIQDRLKLHYQKLLGQGKSTEAVSTIFMTPNIFSSMLSLLLSHNIVFMMSQKSWPGQSY